MSTNDNTACPICNKLLNRRLDPHPLKAIYTCDCPVCGVYAVSRIAMINMHDMAKEDKAKLSAYTRERHIHEMPMITISDKISDAPPAEGPYVRVDDILAAFPSTPSQRLDRALINLHRLSAYPGTKIILNPESDYPVIYAENKEAFFYLMDALKKADWVHGEGVIGMSRVTLTVDGWNRIAELERKILGNDSRQAFIAMWFDSSLENAYKEGFEKAINDAGYIPLRIDLKEHNEKICDVIISEIRRSRFMVADFTGHRGGVYFEAGFAQGLDIPVI